MCVWGGGGAQTNHCPPIKKWRGGGHIPPYPPASYASALYNSESFQKEFPSLLRYIPSIVASSGWWTNGNQMTMGVKVICMPETLMIYNKNNMGVIFTVIIVIFNDTHHIFTVIINGYQWQTYTVTGGLVFPPPPHPASNRNL